MTYEFESGRRVARFRTAGVGRFVQAAFLIFWLCGWAVGETVAVGALVAILASHLPAGWLPLPPLPFPPDPSFSVAAILFLAVWVSFWTLGGIMAAREALHLLWSSDEVQWDGAGLTLIQRLGPFSSRREFAVDQVLGFREVPPHQGLAVQVAGRSVVITRLGSSEERRALRDALRSALAGPSAPSVGNELPDGWVAEPGDNGDHVLRVARDHERSRRVASWIIGALMVMAGVTIMAAGLDADATAGATWFRALGAIPILGGMALILFFALGDSEIRVRPGSVTFVRRIPHHEWRREVTVGLIRLTHQRDSDGDARFNLVIHGDGRKKSVGSALHDPEDLMILGRWLSARVGRPLESDREVQDLE